MKKSYIIAALFQLVWCTYITLNLNKSLSNYRPDEILSPVLI